MENQSNHNQIIEDDYLEDKPLSRGMKLLLKILIFLVLLLVLFIVGLFIGYVLIGDGNFWEVLNFKTWQHIVDFVK